MFEVMQHSLYLLTGAAFICLLSWRVLAVPVLVAHGLNILLLMYVGDGQAMDKFTIFACMDALLALVFLSVALRGTMPKISYILAVLFALGMTAHTALILKEAYWFSGSNDWYRITIITLNTLQALTFVTGVADAINRIYRNIVERVGATGLAYSSFNMRRHTNN